MIDHKPGHADWLTFYINDTGSGISDDKISNLSYPFLSQTQVDHFNHGSGLTFFLCNQLFKKLNGQLNICSKVDISIRHTIRIAMEMEKKAAEKQEKLLDGVTSMLGITSKDVRGIVIEQLQAYGFDCLVNEDRQINCDDDLLLTDNPQRTDDDTLLLAGDEMGW